MARPVDPRLWRHARSARRYLVASVALSLAITGCIVIAALALARVLAGVITDPDRRDIGSWTAELVVFALAVGVRAAATWWQARLAHRAGAQVVAELESAVVAAGAQLPPRELESRRTELAVVAGTGLSGLRAYLAGYLPALLLSALAPPIVLAVIAFHDLVSGGIVFVTLPLIPIFMILIGLLTQGKSKDTLAATTRLSDQLLDLFAGMPTLRALGRESGRAAETTAAQDDSPRTTMSGRVRDLGDALHKRTMSALRIAFLSSMVLEMLATLCVALVAVSIGMRLVFGNMGLYAGLVALILAPEVYLPLRMVGERFHAAQDGMAAADKAFAILEPEEPGKETGARPQLLAERRPSPAVVDHTGAARPAAAASTGAGHLDTAASTGAGHLDTADSPGDGSLVSASAPDPSVAAPARECPGRIEIRGLSIAARHGFAPDALSAVLRPGAVTVLAGPNGCGKSTALQAILGLITPDQGLVTVDGRAIADLDADRWWSHVAWLPQRPVLIPGTLRENLELLGAPAGPEEVTAACAATGFDAVLAELPDGWDTTVGTGGIGLSLGQRQRLALTRTLAAQRQVLLLDEPTAHLDDASEATVLAALVARARAGATVVIVGHRASVLAIADHVVEVKATTTGGGNPVPGGDLGDGGSTSGGPRSDAATGAYAAHVDENPVHGKSATADASRLAVEPGTSATADGHSAPGDSGERPADTGDDGTGGPPSAVAAGAARLDARPVHKESDSAEAGRRAAEADSSVADGGSAVVPESAAAPGVTGANNHGTQRPSRVASHGGSASDRPVGGTGTEDGSTRRDEGPARRESRSAESGGRGGEPGTSAATGRITDVPESDARSHGVAANEPGAQRPSNVASRGGAVSGGSGCDTAEVGVR